VATADHTACEVVTRASPKSQGRDGRDACSERRGGAEESPRRGGCFGMRSVGCRHRGSRPAAVGAELQGQLARVAVADRRRAGADHLALLPAPTVT
jgi:hypothetical protein